MSDVERPKTRSPRAKGESVERSADTHVASSFQAALWAIRETGDLGSAYVIIDRLQLRSRARPVDVRRALDEMARRHGALRTLLRVQEGELVQCVGEEAPFTFEVLEEDESGKDRTDEAVRRVLDASYDVERGPTWRALLLQRARGASRLVVGFSHSIYDEWSSRIFRTQFLECLERAQSGQDVRGPHASPQYTEYARYDRAQLDRHGVRDSAYWSRTLDGYGPFTVGSGRRRAEADRNAGHEPRTLTHAFELTDAALQGIKDVARRARATPFMVMLAAFKACLHVTTARSDVVVGTPFARRDVGRFHEVIGPCMTMLPIRTQTSGDASFIDFVREVRGACTGAYMHQSLPLSAIAAAVRPNVPGLAEDLMRAVFSFHHEATKRKPAASTSTRPQYPFPFLLEATTTEGGCALTLKVSASMMDQGEVDQWGARLAQVTETLLRTPDLALGELDPLLPGERDALLRLGAGPVDVPRPELATLHEAFGRVASAHPEAIAVRAGDAEVTYGELEARANRLARHLQALGAGHGTHVAILLDRGMDLVTSVLAVLKAGAAFVPVNPQYPIERSRFLIEDSGATILVTASAFAHLIPQSGSSGSAAPRRVVLVDDPREAARIRGCASSAPVHGASSTSTAYVIYTSGSTGQPKGVLVAHRSVLNLVDWHVGEYDVGAGSRVSQVAAPAFDASVWEVFPALLSGACLLVVDETRRRDARALAAWLVEEGVTHAFLPTPVVEALAGYEWPTGHRLRFVLTGGDVLTMRPRAEDGFTLVNHYGPTEATVLATAGVVDPAGDGPPGIGRPIANVRVYVLDPHGSLAPPGVPGELVIGGAGVAMGYLNRDELTRERFIPDPFVPEEGEEGARMYRTGDLARWTPEGTLEFLGRVDDQVQVRGHRVEPGEVEHALGEHPAVSQAVVVARRAPGGSVQLVAYYTSAPGGSPIASQAIRAHVAERLPSFMVPQRFVHLDEMPLTPNGKIDRRRLSVIEDVLVEEHEAPRPGLEELVADAWREVFGVPRVGRDDDFFQLGGHSLLATRVASRLATALDVVVPTRMLFEHSTLRGFARALQGLRPDSKTGGRIPARDTSDVPPASHAQQRLWFIHELHDRRATQYNIPLRWRVRGPLDATAIQRALAFVVHRHEVLRTSIVEAGEGSPIQRVQPAGPVQVTTRDLSSFPAHERKERARELARAEASEPFDLTRGANYRFSLLRLDDEDHVLACTFHHVAFDGWSERIFRRELIAAYRAFAQDREPALPPLDVQYADYACWEQQWLRGDVLEQHVSYWREKLAGAPVVSLSADRPRPPVRRHRGGQLPFALEGQVVDRLRILAREHGASLFMTLLSGFITGLARYTGRNDVPVGAPVAGRDREQVEPLIGCFVNTLVLRTDLGGDPTFRDVLDRVRNTCLEAYDHQDVPFETLVAALDPARDLQRDPLFQVSFQFQDASRSGAPPAAASSQEHALALEAFSNASATTSRFDLSLLVRDEGERLAASIVYDVDLFEASTIERFARVVVTLIQCMATRPDERVHAVDVLAADERERTLNAWQGRERQLPRDATVHSVFETQARAHPERVAVTFRETSMTYRELDERANRLARRLQVLGAGPGALVSLAFDRGIEFIVGLFGVLKSGAAYVPLDPEYPQARLRTLFEDTRSPICVTIKAHATTMRDSAGEDLRHVICLDDETYDSGSREEPGAASGSGARSGDLAYVMYTSGSTGAPKGVMIPHSNVVNLAHGLQDVYARGGGGPLSVALNAPFTFDGSVKQILCLLHGHSLHVLDAEERRDPRALASSLEDRPLDVLDCTPSHLRVLLEEGVFERPGAPSQVLVGGEAIDDELWAALAAVPGVRFLNLYGPTECTVDATLQEVTAGSPPSIGRPLLNTRVYVLDGRGNLVPVGVPGELHVGGAGVARGYLNRDELTRERFLRDPFADAPDARMYRTGDIVRWRDDGTLEFLGRADTQVKIRGYRIEPGEVEHALTAHPRIRRALVVARPAPNGDAQLVAYYTAPEGPPLHPLSLREHLAERLPAFMVPAHFVAVDAFPLTRHGKTSPRDLPEPDWSTQTAFAPPRTPVEEMLVDIWRDVIGADRVGIRDDFFALGGHSLLATRVASRIRAKLGVDVPLRTFFQARTIAELARVLASRGSEAPVPPSIPAGCAGIEAPLSYAQQRLWFIDQYQDGKSPEYNFPLRWRLRGDLDVHALERALALVVDRHDVLRSRIRRGDDGHWLQVPDAARPQPLAMRDLGHLPKAKRLRVARELAREEAIRPFDLTVGPLFRFTLVRLSRDDHVLMCTFHHVAFDGWSTHVFRRELTSVYAAFREGREPALPALSVRYMDYATWQRDWLEGGVLEGQLEYWREKLARVPVLVLPTSRVRPTGRSRRGEALTFALDAETTRLLRRLAEEHGATLFMTLLAGFKLVLSRHGGVEDVSVGSPIAGRHHDELEQLIGFFVNTLVLRTDLSGGPSYREVVERVKTTCLEAYDHQDVPFEKLVADLDPARENGQDPLFQATFQFESASSGAAGAPGARDASTPVAETLGVRAFGDGAMPAAKFALSLVMQEIRDGLAGTIVYDAESFEAATVERFARHYRTVVEHMVRAPGESVREVDLLTPEERAIVLPYPEHDAPSVASDVTVHARFREVVHAHGDRVAVASSGEEVTYAQLDDRADRLSRSLRDHGAGPGEFVVLILDPGIDLVTSMLAVLKSGAAFVPVDPEYPTERIHFMLEDSGAAVVVTSRARAPDLTPHARGGKTIHVVLVDDALAGSGERSENDPLRDSQVSGASLAYVIYTSGSTGRPKGVMVPHRNLVNLAEWHIATYGLDTDARSAQVASPAFDASVWEIFPSLLSGGSLHVAAPSHRRDAKALVQWLADERVTHAFLPTPMVEALRDYQWPPHRLRYLLTGGDVLTARPRPEDTFTLVNHYGPTEATVLATAGVVRANGDGRPDVGRPAANARVYVLDAHHRPVPLGVPGEVFIGGPGVARGYLGRDDLTRQRFLPDPLSSLPGAWMYRTGDAARWRPDGTLEFLGRLDNQVKVRGYRIEPGEVEHALADHPEVVQAIVVPAGSGVRDKRLVAYYTTRSARAVDEGVLSDHVGARLPTFMVPHRFMHLDAFPLTPNGKVDRDGLPRVDAAAATEFVAPRSPTEVVIARIWRQVLGVDRVGIHDDFFALGGNSITALTVVSQCSEHGVHVRLASLFSHRTIASLASGAHAESDARDAVSVAARTGPRARILPAQGPDAGPLLILFPAGRVGTSAYNDLMKRVDGAWRVCAVDFGDPAEFDSTETPSGIVDELASLIENGRGREPCILVGWSLGGRLALEVAEDVRVRHGHAVAVVAFDPTVLEADRTFGRDRSTATTIVLSDDARRLRGAWTRTGANVVDVQGVDHHHMMQAPAVDEAWRAVETWLHASQTRGEDADR